MKKNILVGLTSFKEGYFRVLKQEGIPFGIAKTRNRIKPSNFGAIIVNNDLKKNEIEKIKDFVFLGGAVIIPYNYAKPELVPGIAFRVEKINPIMNKGSKFYNGSGLLWLNQPVAIFEGVAPGNPLVKKMGKGWLLVLPFDPETAILDDSYEKRAFFSKKASVSELGPKNSKSTIRVFLRNCIMRLFEKQKIPFVQLWYYPREYKSVFCFHVDLDFIDPDTEKTMDLFNVLEARPTWFLNMDAAKKAGASKIVEKILKEKFVGQHAFVHNFWADEEKSMQNVLLAHKKMLSNGIKAECFSAPNGVWNKGIAMAMQKEEYEFAIAFSLDHDNLPFFPLLEGRRIKTLFVPTHPIAIGVLKQYDFSALDIADYFCMVIKRNEKYNLPIMLYSHPFKELARFQDAIKKAFETAKKRDIWVTNHFDFTKWWSQRQGSSFSAELQQGRLLLKVKKPGCIDYKMKLRVIKGKKQFFLDAKNQRIKLSRLKNGKKLQKGLIQDTAKKASLPGSKYMLKKFLGKGLRLLR